jgi:hypothetical protein
MKIDVVHLRGRLVPYLGLAFLLSSPPAFHLALSTCHLWPRNSAVLVELRLQQHLEEEEVVAWVAARM